MSRAPAPGLVIAGKYRLAERLGGGGMGDVFLAEHKLTGRRVALKLLRAEHSLDDDSTRRFFQEAQAANKIRHPNIVDILDAGFSDNGPYIAMELLVGESSAKALSRLGKLPVEAVVGIGLSVLLALDVAHRAGIIHRDLKPENVYLHRPPGAHSVVVKLLDFGIAKVLEPMGPTPRTHTGVVFGTPDYLSPEQANGEFALDGRSDLFAVGVLLFELLTGTRPFRAATAVATAYKIVHAAAPKLAEAGGPDHPLLEAIIGRALRKRPEERYANVGDFARELELVSPDASARLAAIEALLGAKPKEGPPRSAGSMPSSPPPSLEPARSSETGIIPSSERKRKARLRSAPISSARPQSLMAISALSAPPSTPIESPLPSAPKSIEAPRSAPVGDIALREPPPSGPCLRGSILRAIDRTVVRRHGILVRAGVLEKLPAAYANEFRHSTIAGAALYSLYAFQAYVAALGTLVAGTDATYFREIGRSSAEKELTSLFRPIYRSADHITLLRRGTALWSRLLDFGSWTVRPEGDRVVISVSELSAAPTELRHWLVGMIEQTLWSAGFTNAAIQLSSGELQPAPELVLEVICGQRD